MRRTILFLTLFCLFASFVLANPVDPQRALQIAKEFVPKSSAAKKVQKKGGATTTNNIVYTQKMPKSGRDAFYIVNVGDAFVLVSADDVAHQILGYSFDKGFPVTADGTVQLPHHVKGFFNDLAAQMETAIEANPNQAANEEWSGKRKAAPRRAPSNLPESVGPLLTTTWNQGQYYNSLCPVDAYGPDGHVWTGCVATAMAQIINYWGEPVHGRGTHSYQSNYGPLEVNFIESNYDFSNMPDALTGESTAEQVNAVAKLLYDCGVAVNMSYAAGESAAYDPEARAGLINYFSFSSDLSFAEKAYFSNEEWNNLLRQNLAANQPVYYSGQGTGGHAFVCDGYKADDYYHFNFGWGGLADGWFLTSSVTPNGSDFNSSQSAIVGIVPDNTGNVILGQMQGNSTFIVDEPLEFYHLMGHNKYEGSNYNNPCNSTVTFIPVDDSKQMVADIMEFEDQNVQIYDGTNTDTSLRSLNGGGNYDFVPVVSSANAMMVNYSGNLYYAGFKLILSQDHGFRMVSNISSHVDATTVHLTWIENGGATQWQIEYGIKGFALGNGVVYNAKTNSVTFENLEKFTEYDFYIRSDHGNDRYGAWNKVTIMIEAPYWQDVVTSRPDGYNIKDYNYSVEISSPEAFAWWVGNGCEYDAYLTTDIDLSGYKWKPAYTGRSLNGQGHVISGVYIRETTSDVGLFSDCSPGIIIENVGLNNSYVNSSSYRVGGLFGTFRGIMRNCYVTNSSIDGTDYTGGLIGESDYGTVINCYVNADVIGNRWTGLMIGNSWQGINRNCYAAGTVRHRSYCYMAGIAAYAGAGEITNCYSIETDMGVVGYKGITFVSDTSTIVHSSTGWTLLTPIKFDDVLETDLLAALNRGVAQYNDDLYCVWVADTENENDGFPILGDKYVIQCPNVSDVTAQNDKVGNNNAVVISWIENGNAPQWQIRYRRHDMQDSDYTYVLTSNNPATIQGIPLGYVYDFSVRAVDTENKSGWSKTNTLIVDLPYWTDVVTSQPSGYIEDTEGNVEISSMEGLAWFSVKVNGLYDQTPCSFEGKTVILTSDIDMSGYRWYPIGRYCWQAIEWTKFSGIFDGQNHVLSNIYINDAYSDLGLFGFVENGRVKNTNISGGYIASIYTDYHDSHALHSSAVGGLIGYGVDCYEISDCHSSATIYANGGAGSLCGEIRGDKIQARVTNCTASGTVYGREACGGLIGNVYGKVDVRNCFATGNVEISDGNDNAWYRGGLIGNLMYASVYNCYSLGTVSIDPNSNSYIGNVIGCPYQNTHIHNIYGQDNINEDLELIGNYCEDIADTTQFHHEGNLNTLIKPITVDGEEYSDLLDALNAWVKSQNDQYLKSWVLDNNTGYPVFGENFEPSCYNPTDLTVSQATIVGDNTIRTKLAWNQIGAADYWEVIYVEAEHDIKDGVIITVESNPCVLTDIPVGHPLDFYVRAVRNTNDISNWSTPVTYIPDKLRWTEVVTSQPEGYSEDTSGNVYISSAEGLAWLSSVSNGLNGVQYDRNRFYNKRIYLTSDIDISAYRWVAIGKNWSFSMENAEIKGNHHIITGLYCNELEDYQGLFGYLWYVDISNLNIVQSNVYGENRAGTIAGYALYSNIVNCSARGNVYGIEEVGGIVGRHEGVGSSIKNTCFIGSVASRKDMTKINSYNGYVGGICGTAISDTIINCYIVSEIANTVVYPGIITGTGGCPNIVSNCYYKYYETSLPITSDNCIISNNSSFSGSRTTWTLNSPPYVNGKFHADMLEALNAWVDANNTEGQYRHWVAGTENVNGGFPIFAPAFTLFYKVDGEIYKTLTLEPGTAIAAIAGTTKDGYTFSGWSEIPETMPDHDVTITGSFEQIVPNGDVNGDNKIDTQDAILVIQYYLGANPSDFNTSKADVNGDGNIDTQDAILIIQDYLSNN